ncbi:MAG: glycosyltransferase [Bernardetiaceae bacterium]|nr:glycosyltransferase [Bernardetiaceae bacterium]
MICQLDVQATSMSAPKVHLKSLFIIKTTDSHHIKISVLLAVRNEEHRILPCLEALAALDFPTEQIEVLIGEDCSTDNTAMLIENFISDKPHFRCIPIKDTLGDARAKANVLAHLAQEARGKFFLITDADVRVPPTWAKAMQQAVNTEHAIVNGVTVIEGTTFFERAQSVDWMLAIFVLYQLSKSGIPQAAIGNNMLLRAEAYFEVGGYENLPFSITEDYQMFCETQKKGWATQQLFEPDVLARSEAMPDASAWFTQRLRWMRGAMRIPLQLRLPLMFLSWQLPIVLGLSFFAPLLSLGIWLSLAIFKIWLINIASQRLGLRKTFFDALLYVFYFQIFYGSLLLLHFLHKDKKLDWKGRKL